MTREIVEAAARLSRETLAPRAAWYDRDGVNPVESWRDLHREGLLAAGVPTTQGELGLDS
jgi:alkylation response protein AidB-like acyl-CoA dehydrogenase